MIGFILGRSASGKTTALLQKAQTEIQNGKDVIWIVPEQESMMTEREFKAYGDKLQVLSFHRLADHLMRLYGGGAREKLGEVARVGILYKAVKEVRRELTYYRKSADSVRFFKKLLPVMDDFAAYKVEPEQVLGASDNSEFTAKYRDLFLIYEAFGAQKKTKYRDNFDDLDMTVKLLSAHPFFDGKTVLIDQFAGFTAQEYAILEKIFLQADGVYISLLADEKDAYLFAPTLKHYHRLTHLCDSFGLKYQTTHLSGQYRTRKNELTVLENSLFSLSRPSQKTADDGSVRLFSAASPDAEIRAVAADIRKKVLSGECRYKDIAVVSNVQDEYVRSVEMVFDELDIPLFSDRKVEVLRRPLFAMILHAIDAVQYGYRFEDMFALAKTELCGLDFEQTARLENYAYMWRINGAKWQSEWTQNPLGLDAKEQQKEAADELLRQINDSREKLITPLLEFAEDTKPGKAVDLLSAIWRLICNFGVKERIKEFALSAPSASAGEEWLRLYDLMIEFLDQMALVLGDEPITRTELKDMMEVCLHSFDFGVAPATMDQVRFGDMIRSRSGQVRYLYILSAADGKLPAAVSGSNMITDADIRRLRLQNITLSKDSTDIMAEQQLCIYRTVCSATDGVSFYYPEFSFGGTLQKPSSLVKRITEKLIDIPISIAVAVPTHVSDLRRQCMLLPPENEQRKKLADAVKEIDGMDVADLRPRSEENQLLPKELVEALYHKDLSASQSRMECFADCPFQFFLTYGLKLQETEQITFAANYIGDFVHKGMELLLGAIQKDGSLSSWSKEKVGTFLSDFADDYYEKRLKDIHSARFDHLYDRLTRTMILAGQSAFSELEHSKFFPALQEYHFEETLPLDDDFSYKINGFIDRVDTMTVGDTPYLKVIDYKTGAKKMSLEKIYNGYQLQLPLYADMLCKTPEFSGSKIALMEYYIAGVPKFDAPEQCGDEREAAKQFTRSGLVSNDLSLIEMLDDTENKDYISVKLTKSGTFDARSSSVASDEQFDGLCAFVSRKVKEIMSQMASGDVSVCPVKHSDHNACRYCPYDGICRFEYGKSKTRKYEKIKAAEFFEKTEEGED